MEASAASGGSAGRPLTGTGSLLISSSSQRETSKPLGGGDLTRPGQEIFDMGK